MIGGQTSTIDTDDERRNGHFTMTEHLLVQREQNYEYKKYLACLETPHWIAAGNEGRPSLIIQQGKGVAEYRKTMT